jgi:hypothetical protein
MGAFVPPARTIVTVGPSPVPVDPMGIVYNSASSRVFASDLRMTKKQELIQRKLALNPGSPIAQLLQSKIDPGSACSVLG